jgi:hypothetical protein
MNTSSKWKLETKYDETRTLPREVDAVQKTAHIARRFDVSGMESIASALEATGPSIPIAASNSGEL